MSLQYGMLWLTYVVVVVELEVRSDVEVRYVVAEVRCVAVRLLLLKYDTLQYDCCCWSMNVFVGL